MKSNERIVQKIVLILPGVMKELVISAVPGQTCCPAETFPLLPSTHQTLGSHLGTKLQEGQLLGQMHPPHPCHDRAYQTLSQITL